MKLATILVPAYLPRPYPGATPVPHQSGTVDKFERALADLSPLVIRHAAGTRLHPDASGRFAHPEIVTAYELMVEGHVALAEAIELTLKSFNLVSVTVMFDGDSEPVDAVGVLALEDGFHQWSDA